ncbi:MAG: TIGR01777 family oxidoreductase [Actinobacteria bacterium]|nr:TIGR01777 family oxidoreductase [Actinomycetota bacterium]MBV9933309.1 TIGR01777 family oxidoreductase [Actinomycetota bacterium]
MKVLVTGSHGLIGSALIPVLQQNGHTVTRLVRSSPGPGEARWDPEGGTIDRSALEGVDAVVHLAGVGIGDHRWTEEHKRAVLDSRVKGTRLLSETLATLDTKPVLVSGSAVGYYGNRGDEQLTETSAPGNDFLAEICTQWEAATGAAEAAGVRVVHLRTGIVLAKEGGALKQMLTPFKLGIGGRLGSGRQWFSWIHIDDEIRAIVHALTNDSVRGAMNAVAPNPATNADFTKALGHALHRPTVMPVPAFGLRVLFGRQMADAMLLSGQRVVPAVLQQTGYAFARPDLDAALASVV